MPKLRVIVACLWLLILGAVGVYSYAGGSLIHDVRELITRAPHYGFFVFLIAYTIRPILLIPDSLMLIIGSATFGPWIGFIGGYIGENISALVAFSISRFLGKQWASRSHIAFVQKLERAVTKRGFVTLVFLRLIPVAPFDAINYGAGLTSMRYPTFIAGTALGVLPALVVYVFLGSTLSNPHLAIPAALVILFVVVKLFTMRKVLPDIYSLAMHHHVGQD